jgi:hypothetical protein
MSAVAGGACAAADRRRYSAGGVMFGDAIAVSADTAD